MALTFFDDLQGLNKPNEISAFHGAKLAQTWGKSLDLVDRRYGGEPALNWSHAWSMYRVLILDRLTAELTAFSTLEEMCTAAGNYRPTIYPKDWRYVALADAYDMRQWERNDIRRAWRGVMN